MASITPFAWLLFAARFFDGLTGGNTSIAAAVISDTTTPEDRARAFGLFDASLRLGFMTGPAISYFAQKIPTFPGISHLGMSFFAAICFASAALISALSPKPQMALVFFTIAMLNVVAGVVILKNGKQA